MKYLLSTLTAAGLVAGHGYVTNGTIGGVSYEFYQPYTDRMSTVYAQEPLHGDVWMAGALF